MALSKRNRNIIIIVAVAIAVVVVVALAFLIGRGCEGEEETSTGTTPTSTRTTPTEPPVTVTVERTTPQPEPTPTTTVVVVLPNILDRYVDPEVADPGESLTFSADVQGPASSVTMTVRKKGTDEVAFTLPLIAGAMVGDVTTWSNSAAAPATKGVYRYFASAVATDGTVVEMPGLSGYTFCVGDPMVDCI